MKIKKIFDCVINLEDYPENLEGAILSKLGFILHEKLEACYVDIFFGEWYMEILSDIDTDKTEQQLADFIGEKLTEVRPPEAEDFSIEIRIQSRDAEDFDVEYEPGKDPHVFTY